jgi:hypothetical protein
MNTTNTYTFENNNSMLYRVKFSLLLALQIPAIILSLLIFVFFYKHHAALRALQNQALLILLIVNFIQLSFDLPFSLHFYHLGYVSPRTSTYCTWWNFFSFTLYVTSEYLIALHATSFQSHLSNGILYFRHHSVSMRWHSMEFYPKMVVAMPIATLFTTKF